MAKITKEEFFNVTGAITSFYPKSQLFESKGATLLWYEALKDFSLEQLMEALMEHVRRNIYPPQVSELVEICTRNAIGELPTYDEAWEEAVYLAKNCGQSRPDEAYSQMTPLTYQTIKSIGWKAFCIDERPESVQFAQFRDIYNTKRDEALRKQRMPQKDEDNGKFLEELRVRMLEDSEKCNNRLDIYPEQKLTLN